MSEGIFSNLERIVNSIKTKAKAKLDERKLCSAKIKAEDLANANRYNQAIDIYIGLALTAPDPTNKTANLAYAAHTAIKGAAYEHERACSESETSRDYLRNGKAADAKEHSLNAREYASRATRYLERARILSGIGLKLANEEKVTNNAVIMFLEDRMSCAERMLNSEHDSNIVYLLTRKNGCYDQPRPAVPITGQEPEKPKPTPHPEYGHAAV